MKTVSQISNLLHALQQPVLGAAAAFKLQRRLLAPLLTLCLAFPYPARPIELTQPTAEAFERYVQLTEDRMQSELADPKKFLYLDSLPEKQRDSMFARLRSGYVVIEPMSTRDNGKEIRVTDGFVHHWLAIGFIPGATRDQAVALAEDYPRHPQIYVPDVQQAHVLSQNNHHFLVHYRFYRHTIVTTVYDTEFNVDYFLPDSSRGYCLARTVRIAEVQNPGKPEERELPVGSDHGYMWRLNLYTRYLEKDNGVYVQIEFVALSRSVPSMVAWLVNPYLRSVPSEYLTNYVRTTQKALSAVNISEEKARAVSESPERHEKGHQTLMPGPAQNPPSQQRTLDIPFENYKRIQAAIARYRIYPLTAFYTLFAIFMVIIGFSSAHPWTTVAFFSAGCVTWTFIEYLFHRNVLHGRFPPGKGVIRQFLHKRLDHLHWDHHLRPFDGRHISGELKDILPLFFLAGPICAFFPVYTAPVLLAGLVQSYVVEAWLHYALHFSKSRFPLFRRLKKYHLYHHSPRGINKGYGITTPFWDGVFDPEAVRHSLGRD